MSKDRISAEKLRELVDYDPKTGILTRKVRTSNRVHVGDRVGTVVGNGYRLARIGGHLALEHQFAWLYVHGVWPDHWIDHANGDIQDNRISNLRRSTISQNAGNSKKPTTNTSGFKGVYKKRGKWSADIRCNGDRERLGVFDSPEEAHAAYCEAAQRLFGEFARAA